MQLVRGKQIDCLLSSQIITDVDGSTLAQELMAIQQQYEQITDMLTGLYQIVGDLRDLQVSDKTSLVSAINNIALIVGDAEISAEKIYYALPDAPWDPKDMIDATKFSYTPPDEEYVQIFPNAENMQYEFPDDL